MVNRRIRQEAKTLLVIYLINWVLWFLLVTLLVVSRGGSLTGGVKQFFQLLDYSTFLFGLHLSFGLIYILFLVVRYFYRVGRRLGLRPMLRQLTFRLMIPIGLIIGIYSTLVWANGRENFKPTLGPETLNLSLEVKNLFQGDQKQRGMTVFGWREVNDSAIDNLVAHHVEWLALVPYIYQEDPQTKEVYQREQYDTFSARDSIFIRYINHLHKRDIKVHLKPHLWMRDGWRSEIEMPDQNTWESWFDSYENYVLHYARLAQETNTELFCIGTELHTAVVNRPERWRSLITKVRQIYDGPLTYAANWYEEYEDVKFWDQLDFIGVQAYFPLSDKPNPDLNTIKQGWIPHLEKLEQISQQYAKPILFTEVGYKSEASSTVKPWEWEHALSRLTRKKSDETQHLAFQAIFDDIWDKPWFAGMYIWQWDVRSKPENAAKDLDFSPRFKAAAHTISKGYSQPSY